MLKMKEHYDLMVEFEKRKLGRLDREDKAWWPKGNVYQDGEVNRLFLVFRDGYSLGRSVERLEPTHD